MPRATLVAILSLPILLAPVSVWAETPVMGTTVSISGVSMNEGDSGQTTFTATVSYYGPGLSVPVKIIATPGTADESDYAFAPVELTLSSGSMQTVSGTITGDLFPEGDEYFTLTATAGTGYTGPYFISQGGRVTIVDDDQAHASQLYVDSLSLVEGNSGATAAAVQVRLEPASAYEVTVQFQTQDGSARTGEDYQAANGKLTFAAGEVSKSIPIQILGDTTWESDETFSVVLSQPSMALLGVASATVTIANDDPIAVPTIADFAVDEGSQGTTQVTVTMTFDRPVPAQAKFWYQLADGGATAPTDFQAAATTLYPATGATAMTFTIGVVGDTQPECDEGFYIKYGGSYGIDSTARVAKVILRNDDGQVTGCSDPFTPSTPVSQPIDGGVAPPPIVVDSGLPDLATEVDSSAPVPPPGKPDGATLSGDLAVADAGSPDSATVTSPANTPDAGALPGTTQTERDSGVATQPEDQHLTHSGCAMASGHPGDLQPYILLLVGLALGAGWRRRRRR